MNGNIEHTGKIIKIEENRVTVEMEVEGACASCRVQAACGMTDGKSKIAVVKTENASKYSLGEVVTVSVERGMGIKAILIAYVFPFLVLIGSLLAMTENGVDEIVAGLFSMGLMCVYFVIVFMFKNRIEKEIILKITKI